MTPRKFAHWRVDLLTKSETLGDKRINIAWFIRRYQAECFTCDLNLALPAYNEPKAQEYVVELEPREEEAA